MNKQYPGLIGSICICVPSPPGAILHGRSVVSGSFPNVFMILPLIVPSSCTAPKTLKGCFHIISNSIKLCSWNFIKKVFPLYPAIVSNCNATIITHYYSIRIFFIKPHCMIIAMSPVASSISGFPFFPCFTSIPTNSF